MKTTFKFLGLIALVAAIGFSVSGCRSDPEPEVTIRGAASVGSTLTAASNGTGFSGDFEWWKSPSPGAEAQRGSQISTGSELTLESEHVGYFISVRRYNVSRDWVWSLPIGPIE